MARTPSCGQLRKDTRRVVQVLLELSADVNAQSKQAYTPLMFAARLGDLDIVELLAARGADLNATQAQGATALVIAIQNAHWDVAGLLLDKGADPNAASTGFTALHLATQIRRPELLKFATAGLDGQTRQSRHHQAR